MKRIAVATRWGMAVGGPADAHLSVQDPVDKGEPIELVNKDALFVGLLRLHIANLIRPLGHVDLANALYRLTNQPFAERLQGDLQAARGLLDAAPTREVEKAGVTGGLIGGVITRAGLVTDSDVAPADQEALVRLNLRPVLVRVERDLVRVAVDAGPEGMRTSLTQTVRPDEFARPDGAGGWIVPLRGDRRIIDGS